MEFKIEKKDLKLPSNQEVEVILKVVPHKTGEIYIEKLKWELYNIFKCEYDLVKLSGIVEKNPTKQEFKLAKLPR